MLIKSCKEHDTYMLRNQCSEILNMVQSSMKKGSYNYPTSRYASVSRDPQRNDERLRDLGEALSVKKFVLENQDDDISVKGDAAGHNLARKRSGCASYREINQFGEASEKPFLTHRSRVEAEQAQNNYAEDYKYENTQLEKVKSKLIKKTNKINKLRNEIVEKDRLIESLKQRIRELTQGSLLLNSPTINFERHTVREFERIQTLIVGGAPSWQDLEKSEQKQIHGSVLMVFPKIKEPIFKLYAMRELKKKSTVEFHVSPDSNLQPTKRENQVVSSEHANFEEEDHKYIGQGDLNENSKISSDSSNSETGDNIEENKANQVTSRMELITPIPSTPLEFNIIHSRATNPPHLRKTSSYNCIQGVSIMSSNYNLKREDSRDTLRGDSIRSNEVDRLMRENKRVTKDLRNMFAQYHSVEGIADDDISPAMRSARKAVKAGDNGGDTYAERSHGISGEKRGWQSGRKAQNLMLQEFMANGILETRAEDIQDESDMHIKVRSGSVQMSKVNSKGGSPQLGPSKLDRLIEKQSLSSIDIKKLRTENEKNSNPSSKNGIESAQSVEGSRVKPQIPILNLSGKKTGGKPMNYNLEIACYEKSALEDNHNISKNNDNKIQDNQIEKSQAATKNESIRMLDACSNNGSLSNRLSIYNSIDNKTSRRLHGFIDTFKEPDAEVEDIRSEDEAQQDAEDDQLELRRIMETTKAAETTKNKKLKLSPARQLQHQDTQNEQIPAPNTPHAPQQQQQKQPRTTGQPRSPATAHDAQVIEPSLASGVQSTAKKQVAQARPCSPAGLHGRRRSASDSPDIRYEGLSVCADDRSCVDDGGVENDGVIGRPDVVARLDLSRLKCRTDLIQDSCQEEELVHICSKSVSDISNNLSAARYKKQSFAEKKKPEEEPWLKVDKARRQSKIEINKSGLSQDHLGHYFQTERTNPQWENNHNKSNDGERANQISQDSRSGLWMWENKGHQQEAKFTNEAEYFESQVVDASERRNIKKEYRQDRTPPSSKNVDRQKKLHWQASGVSIREINASPIASAKKSARDKQSSQKRAENNQIVHDNKFMIYRNERIKPEYTPVSNNLQEVANGTKFEVYVDRAERVLPDKPRDNSHKTSYRNLIHLLDNRGNTQENSIGPRSKSRKAHSAINQPHNECDESDCKSIKSTITGFKKDPRLMTTNEKKHMRFKTDYCGVIKHIAINLVEESGSNSNSSTPDYDSHILKKTAAFLHEAPSKTNKTTGQGKSAKAINKSSYMTKNKPEECRKSKPTKKANQDRNQSGTPSVSSSNNKLNISQRRVSNIRRPGVKGDRLNMNEEKQSNMLMDERCTSQHSVLSKPVTAVHSRRHSAIGLANGKNKVGMKVGLGGKAKLYASKISTHQERDVFVGKENSPNKSSIVYPGADLYRAENTFDPVLSSKANVRGAQPTIGSMNSKAQGEYLITSNISNRSKQTKTDASFLGVKINEVQNLYLQDNGGNSQINTERSNNYVLKCRGSPLSNCKYTDVSRVSENNLYGQRNNISQSKASYIIDNSNRKFGRNVQNRTNLNSSSYGLLEKPDISVSAMQGGSPKIDSPLGKGKEKERVSHFSRMNETPYSVHDSIVMMHEILVDKVSDLHQKFIVHEQSSSKKYRSNTKLRRQETSNDDLKPVRLL